MFYSIHLSMTDLFLLFVRSSVCVRLEDKCCVPYEEEGWWRKYNSQKGNYRHNECQGLFGRYTGL